jgi:hypothetical protein
VDSDLLLHHQETTYAAPKVKEASINAKKPSTMTLSSQFTTLGGVPCS